MLDAYVGFGYFYFFSRNFFSNWKILDSTNKALLYVNGPIDPGRRGSRRVAFYGLGGLMLV